MNALKKNGGIMAMIFSVLGTVLWVTMFEQAVMPAFDALWALVGIDDLMFFSILLSYGPTVLLLGVIGGLGYTYIRGYSAVAAKDSNGLIRIVFAALALVLFITTFEPVAQAFIDLHTTYAADPNYPIFGLAVSIAPAVLFITGLVAFIGTGVGGVRAGRKRKGAMAA